MDRNLNNRPAALNIYLTPAHTVSKAAGLNRLISQQPSCAHSAPAALFVDKWITETVYPLTPQNLLQFLLN